MADYTQLSGWNDAYGTLLQQLQALHSDSGQAETSVKGRINNATDQFASSFNNMVGRQPTNDEINQFLKQSAGSIISQSGGGLGRSETDTQNVNNQIQQFVGNNFAQAANDTAIQKLKDQQSQYQDLANQSLSMGNTAINDTEQSLLKYQSSLFDRLRPNLLTSLKAQGLLDTGGMNEAMAGVQGDLANNASNYVAQLHYQNAQNANQIALTGASNPVTYNTGVIQGQPGAFNAASNAATGFNNSTYMDNLNYQHQLGLINAQMNADLNMQPSFMRTFSQNFGQHFGSTLGNNVGNQIVPSGGGSSSGFTNLLG